MAKRVQRSEHVLRLRGDLAQLITRSMREQGFRKLCDAARHLGILECQMTKVRHGRIEKITLDWLIEVAALCGHHIDLRITNGGRS